MALGLLALAGLGIAGATGAVAAGDYLSKPDYSDPDRMDKPTGYAASQATMIQELIRRHNAGELNLPPHRVEQLSQAAAQLGIKFEVESKPFRKFLFDAADSLTLGLIPNEWRPKSIGEDLHGETLTDRWFGGLGTVGGGFAGGGLLLKGGAKALGGIKGWASKGTAAQGAARSVSNAKNYVASTPAVQGARNYMTTPGASGLSVADRLRYPSVNLLNPTGSTLMNPNMQFGGGLLSMPAFSGYRRGLGTSSIPMIG